MRLKHSGFHRYELRNIGKKSEYMVYHCNLPGCTHYKQATTAMMSNVMSLCNRCNEPFLWNKESNRGQVKPHCGSVGCKKKVDHKGLFRKKPETKEVNKDAVQSILNTLFTKIAPVEKESYKEDGKEK